MAKIAILTKRDPLNVTHANQFKRSLLRGSSAFSALAMLGAGLATTVIATSPVAAQDYTNVIASGRVLGPDQAPVAGATVTITSNNQGFVRTVTTDNQGNYRVPQLPQGNYTFTIEANGFATFTDPDIDLNASNSGNTFRLVPAGSETTTTNAEGDTILVTGTRIKVSDFERTTTGAVIPIGELATRVPVARDVTSIIQLAPGTTVGDTAFLAGNTPGNGNLSNISGASVAENVFFLNGLNITNFRNGLGAVAVPFEFYQTVEVKTGGFPAEFGRGTGGVVNAVTKSGGNEFHGSVLFNYEPDWGTEDSPNTYASDNDSDYRYRTDTVVQLSGPIIKDRLFFYGLYNWRKYRQQDGLTSLTGGTAPGPNQQVLGSQYRIDTSDSPFWGGKLDAIITDGHRLEFTYFDSGSTLRRDIFGTAASPVRFNPATNDPGSYASTTIFRSGGENYVGRYTGAFTDWLTLSAAYGKNKFRETTEPTNPGFPSIIDQRTGSAISIGNPTANSQTNFDTREFYRGDIDLFFNLFGSHHVRGGYDRENLSTTILTSANGGGQYTIDTGDGSADTLGILGDYVTVRTFVNGGNFKSRNEAFYLQDSWSLFDNRITIQAGIRNDRFRNYNIAGDILYKSKNQWGPRLGFTADPFGDGATKVYGSFGRYFFPIAASTNNRLGGAELDYDRFFQFAGFDALGVPILGARLAPLGGVACPAASGESGTCIIRGDGEARDSSSQISQNLKSQGLDEYIVGAERRLSRLIRVGVYYTHRKLNRALEDTSIDPFVQAYCTANGIPLTNNGPDGEADTGDETGCAQVFSGTHQYVLFNPGSSITVPLADLLPGDTSVRTLTFDASSIPYNKATRKYDAVTLQVDRDFDGIWSLSGSYTWSKLKGSYEGAVRSENGQIDAGAGVDYDLPGIQAGDYGYLPNDRRHNFKLYGSYKLFDWLNIGATATVQSPRRFGCIGLVPAAIDPIANAQYGANGRFCVTDSSGNVITTGTGTTTLIPRGTGFKSDWTTNINLDLAAKIPSDDFDATFRVSVFNLLNSKAETDFQEVGTTGAGAPRIDYGAVTTYQLPRSIRFQISMGF